MNALTKLDVVVRTATKPQTAISNLMSLCEDSGAAE